jgi:hypothetical protein
MPTKSEAERQRLGAEHQGVGAEPPGEDDEARYRERRQQHAQATEAKPPPADWAFRAPIVREGSYAQAPPIEGFRDHLRDAWR